MMPSARTHSSTSLATGNGSSSSSRSKATLEIIPENRFIVFHGSEHEASSVILRGVVRLTTAESMTISRPRVRLEGKRKIAWYYTTGLGAGEVADKRVFWREEQKIGVESAHKIKAGVMEWPFEFELAPAMPESVEGLRESYIAYHLHASVARPGWNTKGLAAQEHIRLVRTLGPDSMGMTRSRINADIWANKISYSISIPTDAVVFGTSITADVELSPLRKGLRLGQVELKLVETVVKRIHVADVPDARSDRMKSEELDVAKDQMDFPEETKVIYDSETADDPIMADEMYKFKATLPLPKSLNLCRQDVDSHQISITHRFKLMVNIHNPEGHISQLVCKLPVKLFISPNLPVDESNRVQAGAVGLTDEQLNNTDVGAIAPPQYGQHQLDQIFSDIDTAGYLSRGGSNPVTPAGLGSRSRRASNENLASLNGLTNGDVAPISSSSLSSDTQHGDATPSILRSRLAALQERSSSHQSRQQSNVAFATSAPNTTSPPTGRLSEREDHITPSTSATRSSYFPAMLSSSNPTSAPNASSNTSSAARSRRNSISPPRDAAMHTSDYNMSDLTRVPSYGAALRTSGTLTPYNEGPPSYVEATSRPPSPGQAAGTSPPAFTPSSPSNLQISSTANESDANYQSQASPTSPTLPNSATSSSTWQSTLGSQSNANPIPRPSRAHVRAPSGGLSGAGGGASPSAASSTASLSGGLGRLALQQQHTAHQREEENRLRMLRART